MVAGGCCRDRCVGVSPSGRAGAAGEKQPGRARQPASSVWLGIGMGSRLVPALFHYALLAQALVTNKHCCEREIAPGGWQHKDLEQCKLSHGACNLLLRPTHFLSFPTPTAEPTTAPARPSCHNG